MARGKFQHELKLIRKRQASKSRHFKELAKKKLADQFKQQKDCEK